MFRCRQNRQHVADLHTGGPEALLTVADGRVHDLKPWHELTPPYTQVSQRSSFGL